MGFTKVPLPYHPKQPTIPIKPLDDNRAALTTQGTWLDKKYKKPHKKPYAKIKTKNNAYIVYRSIEKMTEKACLLVLNDLTEEWFPLSYIDINKAEKVILVPKWLLRKKGIDYDE